MNQAASWPWRLHHGKQAVSIHNVTGKVKDVNQQLYDITGFDFAASPVIGKLKCGNACEPTAAMSQLLNFDHELWSGNLQLSVLTLHQVSKGVICIEQYITRLYGLKLACMQIGFSNTLYTWASAMLAAKTSLDAYMHPVCNQRLEQNCAITTLCKQYVPGSLGVVVTQTLSSYTNKCTIGDQAQPHANNG